MYLCSACNSFQDLDGVRQARFRLHYPSWREMEHSPDELDIFFCEEHFNNWESNFTRTRDWVVTLIEECPEPNCHLVKDHEGGHLDMRDLL